MEENHYSLFFSFPPCLFLFFLGKLINNEIYIYSFFLSCRRRRKTGHRRQQTITRSRPNRKKETFPHCFYVAIFVFWTKIWLTNTRLKYEILQEKSGKIAFFYFYLSFLLNGTHSLVFQSSKFEICIYLHSLQYATKTKQKCIKEEVHEDDHQVCVCVCVAFQKRPKGNCLNERKVFDLLSRSPLSQVLISQQQQQQQNSRLSSYIFLENYFSYLGTCWCLVGFLKVFNCDLFKPFSAAAATFRLRRRTRQRERERQKEQE